MPKEPSPDKYLVILLGASEWPKSPEFRQSRAFVNSAQKFQDYFLNEQKFGLPMKNLLNLFDSNRSNDELDELINEWIRARVLVSQETSRAPTDLIVLFIGHGGFINGVDEYFLAIRRTRATNPGASSIPITTLAKTIKESARYLRRYIILDCCFAASAYKHFQSTEVAQIATKQTFEAFAMPGKGRGVPERGTTLFCSSRHNKPSLLSPDEEFTMFSEALLYALDHGNPSYEEYISIENICMLTQDYLQMRYQDEAPLPEVHSPDQSEGDVAHVPLFPNLAERKSARLLVEKPEVGEQESESLGLRPIRESDKEPTKSIKFPKIHPTIWIAIAGSIVALMTVYWQFVYKPSHYSVTKVHYAGRVIDAKTHRVLPGAKASVDIQGTPQVYYTDSEGIFYFEIAASISTARIRVEANGYEVFEGNITPTRTGVEEVPLISFERTTPTPTPPPVASPQKLQTRPKPSKRDPALDILEGKRGNG